MSNVFIAFQVNEESRPVVDAILATTPMPQRCIPPVW